MSWRDAPLYVEAHDLAREVHARTPSWEQAGHTALALAAAGAADELLAAVALALTFPMTRGADLLAADRAVVRLRCLLRVAHELGLLSAGAHRLLGRRLLAAGRMIGGWRKRVDRSSLPSPAPGCGPPPAAGA